MSTITITKPVTKQLYQRNRGTGIGSIPINGTYTGGPTTKEVEASFNGGAYQQIATGAAGVYSGTLTNAAKGEGTLTVRFVNDTSTTATVALIRVGVWIFVFGQSNAGGEGTNQQPYTAVFGGTMYTHYNTTFADISDPTQGATGSGYGGSPWPRLCAMLAAYNDCPAGVASYAVGGTSITGFQPGGGTYTAIKASFNETGGLAEFAFWLQGETDAVNGMSQGTYTTNFANIVAQFVTDFPTVRIMPSTLYNSTSEGTAPQRAAINAALESFWTDPRCYHGPDVSAVPTDGVHAISDESLSDSASKIFAAVVTNVYGGGGGGVLIF